MLIDINWEEFFDGGAFEDITKESNKIWIVAIDQDPFSNSISSSITFEVTNVKRNQIVASDSYLTYRYLEKSRKNGKISPRGIVTQYIYKSKITDSRNNLILICDVEEYGFGGSELIEIIDTD
ncbi:hypothetical protein [Ruminiclostridium cellulolyticum]|uniref:Uncharacterized protein n=1 Tax=Ruminiclostridium cellulolyticum (strain ATCC 35319 / DSM 5812 / JCM 6584 / H10) TaxID=394503 RepID=B8I328_RUMCH|nr:hypothetical protein [Ruminiclostridium cellulolyticum]ACL76171.1 hypothetical protein Ccel_1822 [Ruminiclostridium cellulolyticum H10]